jgi:phosphoadenosine phosphosulfate reductase
MQSLPLLHMIATFAPDLPVIFLDTGYHFPETLLFRDQIVELWQLNLRVVRARSSVFEQAKRYGPELHRTDPDLCCHINKVEPMQRILGDFEGWISGIRRDQSPARAHIPIIEETAGGVVRIHPLAAWTRADIWRYIHQHNLPTHPLFSKGYLSIGCAPCTRPLISDDEDDRAGRWPGSQKIECGLHSQLRPQNQLVDLPSGQ